MIFNDRRISVKDRTVSFIAVLYTFGYFAVLYMVMTKGIPEQNTDSFNILLGILSSIQMSIISYFFGSSKGSDDKNATVLAAVTSSNGNTGKIDDPIPSVVAKS